MMKLNELLNIAKRYNADNYRIAGIDNSNSTCEIIIDRLKNTIAISEYDWDWGCMRTPVETVKIDRCAYYIVIIDENNINEDTRIENYIKNNYGDDEDDDTEDDEENGTPYDDEEVYKREFGFYDDDDEDDLD